MWNIQNYVHFVYQHRDDLSSEAPAWVKTAVKARFGASAKLPKPSLGPKWSWNNKAHAHLFVFLAEGQLSDRQKEKGFDTVGMLKLRDLSYWQKNHVAMEIWKRNLKAMAEKLDIYCCTNNGIYENKFNTQKTVATFETAFDDSARYVHEIGELCDKIYRYE